MPWLRRYRWAVAATGVDWNCIDEPPDCRPEPGRAYHHRSGRFDHALGASGTRIMTAMLHHMRNNGIRYGLQTMFEHGGQADAAILELL